MQMLGDPCGECGFELWVPIGMLNVTALGLYDDDRFPGRCLVAYTTHIEHLDELDDGQLLSFMSDVREVGRAVREVTGAPRVNDAVLGHVHPHLHAHVIPRGGSQDAKPDRAPWQHPKPAGPLDPKQREEVVNDLGRSLRFRS